MRKPGPEVPKWHPPVRPRCNVPATWYAGDSLTPRVPFGVLIPHTRLPLAAEMAVRGSAAGLEDVACALELVSDANRHDLSTALR